MPIDGTQNLDKNSTKYGLPIDTCCVGGGGPTPMEAATISKSAATPSVPPNPFVLKGGTTRGWGASVGKSPAQSSNPDSTVPVGYNGP